MDIDKILIQEVLKTMADIEDIRKKHLEDINMLLKRVETIEKIIFEHPEEG